MFENFKTFEYELSGRKLVIETGKMAGLANGSCLVRFGDTVILGNPCCTLKTPWSSAGSSTSSGKPDAKKGIPCGSPGLNLTLLTEFAYPALHRSG